ncbi:MAG: hypothetical protein RMZ69_06515 [Nostoc sp. ChiQUE01a]|nr:hypothetical protein [Nostoc sp. ChiQUE01a]
MRLRQIFFLCVLCALCVRLRQAALRLRSLSSLAHLHRENIEVLVALLLETGMYVELIAQQLNVDVEAVRLAAQENT